MAYRFSDTLKWSDSWFVELGSIEKLLFLYLCDNCDIGGFFELSIRKIAFDLGTSSENIKGAIKGLERGLILSDDETSVLVKNFIKHQKNLPLNPANKAHKGIISRFNMYSNKFTGLELDVKLGYKKEAPLKPLQRGTGIGIGNDIDKVYTSNNILDDFEEKKEDDFNAEFESKKSELIDVISKKYGYDENRFYNKKRVVMAYIDVTIKTDADYDFFIRNFNAYIKYKTEADEKQHGFDGLFGTQKEKFNDGALNSENWEQKLLNLSPKKQSNFEKLKDAYNAPNPYRK